MHLINVVIQHPYEKLNTNICLEIPKDIQFSAETPCHMYSADRALCGLKQSGRMWSIVLVNVTEPVICEPFYMPINCALAKFDVYNIIYLIGTP